MALAAAAPAVSYGQAVTSDSAAGEKAVELPKFNVTETPVDVYNSSEASSALKTAGRILDTSSTVYVITPAMIQDINPNTVSELTTYFAGITNGRASGIGGYNDRMTFRGIESFGTTRDNFADLMVPYMVAPFDNFDTIFMDHAELVMGPDSVISPTGTAGGTIVAQTKSPQFTQHGEFSINVGNYNAGRETLDFTGPIGNSRHWAYRMLLARQDIHTYQPGRLAGWAGSGQLTYKVSDRTQNVFKYFGQQQLKGGTGGQSSVDGVEVYTPDTVGGVTLSNKPEPGFTYNGWNGQATWDYRLLRDNVIQDEMTTSIGDHLSARLGAQIFYNTEHDDRAYPTPPLTEAWNPQTGQEISVVPINPASVPITYLQSINHSTQRQYEGDLAGAYELPGVSLNPTVGFNYQAGNMDFLSFADHNLPNVNLYQQVYNPPVPQNADLSFNANTPYVGWTLNGYGNVRAGFFHDRFFASLGGSRTWANDNIYTVPRGTRDDGVVLGNTNPAAINLNTFSNTHNPLAPSVQPWHDSYLAGALYKVTDFISIYYSFTTNSALAEAIPLWQAGKQHEFGAKANFFHNRLSINADHYQIRESNISYMNPAYIIGTSTIPNIYTNLTNHGEEVNVMGGVTNNLSIIASFTNMKLRDFAGRPQRNIPDTAANLLLDYHFKFMNATGDHSQNSDVFVGILNEGKVAGENVTGFTALGVPEQPGYYIASYTVANAGASYKYGRYRFNLNVSNLTNEKFWWEASARSSLEPWTGFTAILKMTVSL